MSIENSLDAKNILDRAKRFLGLKRDLDLADRLEIAQPTLSTWKSRGGIDLERIIATCKGANLNWLVYGEGEMTSASKPGLRVNDKSEGYQAGQLDISQAIPPVDWEGMAIGEVQERMAAAKRDGQVRYYMKITFQKLSREDVEGRGLEGE